MASETVSSILGQTWLWDSHAVDKDLPENTGLQEKYPKNWLFLKIWNKFIQVKGRWYETDMYPFLFFLKGFSKEQQVNT